LRLRPGKWAATSIAEGRAQARASKTRMRAENRLKRDA
jgi:hypothetical protein